MMELQNMKSSTNSFIYSNNENRAEQGIPVPVVYGQLRVGSQLIHSSIHNYDYNYDDALIYEGFQKELDCLKLQMVETMLY